MADILSIAIPAGRKKQAAREAACSQAKDQLASERARCEKEERQHRRHHDLRLPSLNEQSSCWAGTTS